MKVTSNNINFKSKIKVVSPADYEFISWKLSRNENVDDIYKWMLDPKQVYTPEHKCYRTNSKFLATEGIRSCIAGVFSSKDNLDSFAMHIYDNEDNFHRLSTLDSYIKGTDAFLVGSREDYPESKKIFDYFKEKIKLGKMSATILESFNDLWEANFIRIAESDEIILCIKDILNPKKYVKNMEELMQAFKKVQISPNDTFEFLSSQVAKVVAKR